MYAKETVSYMNQPKEYCKQQEQIARPHTFNSLAYTIQSHVTSVSVVGAYRPALLVQIIWQRIKRQVAGMGLISCVTSNLQFATDPRT